MESLLKQKVEEIAHCMYEDVQKNVINSWGLYHGAFGQLLFLLYYSDYNSNKNSVLLAEQYAEKLLYEFVEKENDYTFGYGLAGELYLIDFLREQNIIDLDLGNIQSVFEKYLLTQLRVNIKNNYYDFMHGTLGLGLYFLKKSSHTDYILEVVNFLYNTADRKANNTIFKWESNLIYRKNIIGYNLSLSHGMSSIIIFLSRVIKSGISNDKIQTMLNGAVNYILSQELDFCQFGFCFPNYIIKNSSTSVVKSRLAWCYGDLGVGIALWHAGVVTLNKSWQDKAVQIFLKSIHRKNLEKNFIIDPGICHGSAGIAMIFRRMYILTKNEDFHKASLFWLNQTLDFSYFEDGLAGYKSAINNNKWICDYSLLTGISGIGLVFMSYLNEDQQIWDELFLLT